MPDNALYKPDFDLVSTWVYQSLLQNETLVAAHGGSLAPRFYDSDTVPDDPRHPYIYWTKNVIGKPEYLGIAGKIAREQYRVTVRSRLANPGAKVASFGIAGAVGGKLYSVRDLTGWARNIYDATVGHNGRNIFNSQDVKLGMVTESVYQAPWEFSMTDKGVKFVERGVILEVMVQYI